MAKDKQLSLRLDEAGDRGEGCHAPAQQRGARWRGLGMVLLWYLVAVALLSLELKFESYPTELGVKARARVLAPFEFELEDREATEQKTREAFESKKHVWERDPEVLSGARQGLNAFANLLGERNPSNAEQLKDFSDELIQLHDIALDATTISRLLPSRLLQSKPPLTLSDVRKDLRLVINDILGDRNIVDNKNKFQAHHTAGVLVLESTSGLREQPPEDPDKVLLWPEGARNYLLNKALDRYFRGEGREELREALTDLLMELFSPNIVYNPDLTATLYEGEITWLEQHPETKDYKPGEVIVDKDEALSQLQADALAELNERRRVTMSIKLMGIFLVTVVVFMTVAIYIRRVVHRDLSFDATTVTLHALPPILAIGLTQCLLWLGAPPETMIYWFPAPLVGMLAALLIAPEVALLLVLVASLLMGIIAGQGIGFMVVPLFGGFAAVLASRTVRARAEVLKVGLQVGVVNVLAVVILGFLNSKMAPDWDLLLFAFLNAITCSLATLVFLVIFESVFGIVTDLKLLELTGLKHPLIRQLEDKAPGSYQHVLNVTKLAEAAAEAIGANYLLVRAGAYFHDIGKMLKPNYFSENQVTLEDKKIHSRLSPYMSVLVIKNHVKEGIELAQQYKLPQKIIDFIPQHHGTGLIRFFYSEALRRYEESEAVDPVREEDFRYAGPRPQTIETAIVLLADSVEAIAASRFTGGQVSEDELRRSVQMAITERFNDGQFDECDLTLAHLGKIREALVKSLLARFHFRVAYPALTKRGATRQRGEVAGPTIAVAGPASSVG